MHWLQEVDSDITEEFLKHVTELHAEECGMRYGWR